MTPTRLGRLRLKLPAGMACVLTACAGLGQAALAQTASEGQSTTAVFTDSERPPPPAPTWSLGLAWFRYSEADMKLQGPELTWGVQHDLQQPGWPDRLEADLGMGSLRYTSQDSGSLSRLPLLHGRASVLWRLTPSSQLRAGLQLEATWTDLRGTTSTGDSGYERLNTKAWLVLHCDHPGHARTEVGLLLRGRQQTFLSQVPVEPRLPDITNTQTQGVYLAYRHSPIGSSEAGAHGLRPWIRYTQVSASDQVSVYRWYEPRNRSLSLGLEYSW